MLKLEDTNLLLRAPEPEDLEVLYRWENDTDLWQVSNTIEPISRFQLRQFIENSHQDIYESRQRRFMIELKKNPGLVIGSIDVFDFDPFHRRAGLGIVIEKQYRQSGFASQALNVILDYVFKYLNLRQLYCNILPDNEASIRLFKKHGFELIGVKKQWIKTMKGFSDELMFQLINPF